MLTHERELWGQGLARIAGVDEVGRGCLFGDVVAAAVIMPVGVEVEEINDSKKLSEKKRDYCYDQIQQLAVAVGVGRVSAAQIDEMNIKQAARLAMKLAVEQLPVGPDYLLIDAERIDCAVPQLAIVKGDQLSQSIAAASIVAKVTRDRLCAEWDRMYPEYGIAAHKGYATSQHRAQIKLFGASPLHRRSFLRNIEHEQMTLF